MAHRPLFLFFGKPEMLPCPVGRTMVPERLHLDPVVPDPKVQPVDKSAVAALFFETPSRNLNPFPVRNLIIGLFAHTRISFPRN